ncbi:MAG: hypothetical protein MO852_01485 [Candidatus Devosia euplotis]|nr:hypothetical protein [Candidatus Devosia euplotis]
MLKGLAALRKRGVTGPLFGVHALEAVETMQHGTSTRAFALLGCDAPTVMVAIRSEMTMAA